jgi:hypothetical protein
MPRVGFKPIIPVFERAKTVHALDRLATCKDIDLYKHAKLVDTVQIEPVTIL